MSFYACDGHFKISPCAISFFVCSFCSSDLLWLKIKRSLCDGHIPLRSSKNIKRENITKQNLLSSIHIEHKLNTVQTREPVGGNNKKRLHRRTWWIGEGRKHAHDGSNANGVVSEVQNNAPPAREIFKQRLDVGDVVVVQTYPPFVHNPDKQQREVRRSSAPFEKMPTFSQDWKRKCSHFGRQNCLRSGCAQSVLFHQYHSENL